MKGQAESRFDRIMNVLVVIGLIFLLVFLFVSTLSRVARADIEFHGSIPGVFGLLGVGPGTNIIVTNASPLWAELVVLNKSVCVVMSGATVFGEPSSKHEFAEISLIAVMRDQGIADTSAYGKIVGIASTKIWARRGESSTWVIRTEDIRRTDGQQVYYAAASGSPYPSPDVESGGKVKFPGVFLASTTSVQFANVTNFDASIRLDGEERTTLSTFGLYYASYASPKAPQLPVRLNVIFSDRGRLVGSYEETFYAYGNNHPRAHQIILTPDKIRRY